MLKQAFRLPLLLFFGVQLLAICVGVFTEVKYFNWVPYDEISHYTITVNLPDRELSPAEIFTRYRKPAVGRENRDIDNLLSIIRQYECTYGADAGARVHVHYRTNNHVNHAWTWPH